MADRLPGHNPFDHVITRVVTDGEVFFLDATRDDQLGDLDHLEQAHYGKGLLLTSDSAGLIDVSPDRPDWYIDSVYKFDLVAEEGVILFQPTFNYYGQWADSNMSWITDDGTEDIDKEFREYFQNNYPTLQETRPVEVHIDREKAHISFSFDYRIEKGWEPDPDNDKKVEQDFYPWDVRADLPKFVGANRATPYEIEYPVRLRETLQFQMDDTWSMSDGKLLEDNDSFRYAKISTFENNVYTDRYEYVTKRDAIMPAEFASIMTTIDKLRNESWLNLYMWTDAARAADEADEADEAKEIVDGVLGDEFWLRLEEYASTLDKADEAEEVVEDVLDDDFWLWLDEYAGALFGGWMLLAAIGTVIYLSIAGDNDFAMRREFVFYPVSMTKFAVMSFMTFGLYQYYWIFKNWQWVRDVENEVISPFWRTFFSVIFNFSLFSRLGKAEGGGYPWFRYVAIPLAVLSLLSELLDGIVNQGDDLTPLDLLTFAPFLVLFPVAAQALKLNSDRKALVAENSRFTWQSYVVMLMFAPVVLLALLGVAAVLFL